MNADTFRIDEIRLTALARITLVMTAVLTCLPSPAPARETHPFPDDDWPRATPEELGMDRAKLDAAREYAETGGGSGIVTRRGRVVLTWGDQGRRYDLKSTTKSIGVTALGIALMDGKITLEEPAIRSHPDLGKQPESNRESGWLPKITIRHLATQTAGFEKPGGFTKLLFEPGTKWDYSDSGPNWLAECITLRYGRDLRDLMFERVFTPLGITSDDLTWRRNAYRPRKIAGVARREFGSGISANVDAMARIGSLYLREGTWRDGKQLVPRDFVAMARRPLEGVVGLPEHGANHGNASDHYGLLWWNNADGTLKNVPRDAYWSWGLYDSLILVVPSLDLVVARAGKSWSREGWSGHYEVLAPFFDPLVAACGDTVSIQTIEWAPVTTIVRKAKGSDNWPITWGDDGHQYTAYGDGWGFEPRTKKKLSLGFARIEGGLGDFKGINIRSPSGERFGDGKRGAKASGILMVDGILYLWARNTGNSQLVTSRDRGATWEWADWKFTTSFGAPTFLNRGRDHEDAPDDFVYVYSFDSGSAYQPADRMVLARVPKSRIAERESYRFFVRRTDDGGAEWSADIERRGAVLRDPGQCYRSGVSFNAGLGRYLWAQVKGGNDTRFKGGLAIYEAATPWGPWREFFRTDDWDTGPGESASFPTKWMSADGRTVHLVFSGEDAFSVRRGTLVTRER